MKKSHFLGSCMILIVSGALGGEMAEDFRLQSVAIKVVHEEVLAEEMDVAKECLSSGLAKKQKGDFEAALLEFDRYLELVGEPKNHLVFIYRANTRKSLGDLEGAIQELTTAMSLFPENGDLVARRAAFLRNNGDIAGAVADEKRVDELRKIKILMHIEKLNNGIASSPGSAFLYMERAKLWVKMGDADRAMQDVSSALEIDSQNLMAIRLKKKIQYFLNDKGSTKKDRDSDG
ncbi:hypothetical protein P0Y35_17590 [Kiritimatiellaeota bacterium B1221]|nr:hypothetical protein [Kiritimatiellaeota bacterium B1221]